MRLLKVIFFVSFFFLLIVSGVFAQTFQEPAGYVNDFAHLYSPNFVTDLEQKLQFFESSTSAEIAVVTVNDLQGTTIEDYAVRLFENWKIGKENKDNGVLVLIAKEEREVRIEVGYGLEPVVTDARAGRIIREQMTPAFRENDYEKGTADAVAVIMQYVRGEAVPDEQPQESPDWSGLLDLIPFFFFGVIYLGSFLARSKSFYAGGIIGAIIGIVIGLFVGGFLAVLFIGLGVSLLGLLLDYVLSRNYQHLKSQHKRTDWWGSRGGFYGGGRGFGGGGFGGFGGGSSGGGGASGRW